jgi:hypothetical protein
MVTQYTLLRKTYDAASAPVWARVNLAWGLTPLPRTPGLRSPEAVAYTFTALDTQGPLEVLYKAACLASFGHAAGGKVRPAAAGTFVTGRRTQ